MAFEDSYKAQLQGVSQQLPKDRLDGQLTEQVNMLSDTVTNLRRRPGLAYATDFWMVGATNSNTAAWSTNIGDIPAQVFMNTATGEVRVLAFDSIGGEYTTVLTFSDNYLVTPDVRSISTVSLGDELFMLNSAKVVGKEPTQPVAGAPKERGYFEIIAGAFSKKYEITIEVSPGNVRTFAYTTPTGAVVGDADMSTPAYIANRLVALIVAEPDFGVAGNPTGLVDAITDGGTVYVYYRSSLDVNMRVSTGSGKAFIGTSGFSYVADAADLPPQLPEAADGYVMSTGSASLPVYYQYVAATRTWLEASEFSSRYNYMRDYPISIRRGKPESGEPLLYKVDTTFEPRFAGDEFSNPDPAFMGKYITGIGSYQGRLVLLSGNTVSLSASGKPRRFYRSTVTSVLDSDVISVAAASAASAEWRQCVEYGKDLLVFSELYQGVIPGTGTAITPRNAALLIPSKYAGDVTTAPVNIGRTVLFAKPVNDEHFGIMEMVPSQYSDSTYTAYESTAHLPRYMGGRCSVAAASSVANLAVFLSTTDRNTVVVHEYTWQGDTKIQQAWHKWTFEYPVVSVYFVGARLHVVFVRDEVVLIGTMDPKASVSIADPVYNAPLDFKIVADVSRAQVSRMPWMYSFASDSLSKFRACTASGPLASEPVKLSSGALYFDTPPGYPDGKVILGIPFKSTVEFTPPMLKDHNGVRITTNKTTVARFILGTNASREFSISVSDRHPMPGSEYDPYDSGPLYYSSTELELGQARVGGPDSSVVIPARTLAESTKLVLTSDSTGEMNITSLEYVMKTKEKIQRKKG